MTEFWEILTIVSTTSRHIMLRGPLEDEKQGPLATYDAEDPVCLCSRIVDRRDSGGRLCFTQAPKRPAGRIDANSDEHAGDESSSQRAE